MLQIDQQHLAGLKPPFADDLLVGNRKHTAFRGHDDLIILGHAEAGRAEAVSVQRRANLTPVGKSNGSGAIPRFHEGGIIFIEGPPFRIHQRIARPRFGDEQHHRFRQRISPGKQQFQCVIKRCRVRLTVRDERPHFIKVRPDEVRLQCPPARVHPVDVAAHRVDFTIVRDEAVGVGELPRGEGVG